MKKIKHSKSMILLICVLLIMNALAIPAYAQSGDPMGEAFPSLNKILDKGDTSKAKFLDGTKYYLDVKPGKIIDPPPVLNNIANTVLEGIKGCVILLIYLVVLSFKIKVFDDFSGILKTVMKPLKVVIFDQWLITAILIFAFWMLLSLYFTSKRTNIYKNIIAAAMIIGMAIAFLNNPTLFLDKMNDISQSMCNEIIEGSFNRNYKAASTDDALVSLGNQIWKTMVEKPWMLLEFGSEKEAKKNMGEILKYEPNDDKRIELAKEFAETNSLFTKEDSYKRLGFVIFYSFAMLPMLIVLLIIAGLNIGFQFLVMFFALWAPVIFILSIIPKFGMNTFLSWFSKEAGFFVMKIALTMFMAILFVFHNEIFNTSAKYGFILVILIQTISTVMVILFRKKIFGFAASIQYGENGIKRSMKAKTPILNQAKNDARRVGRAALAASRPVDWAMGKLGAAAMGPAGAVAHPVALAVNKVYESTPKMYEKGVNAVSTVTASMSRQMKNRKVAQNYLWDKYRFEKAEAEQQANKESKRLGRKVTPNYNGFVKEKMNLEKMNATVFSNREVNAVAKEFQHILDHGGSQEDLFATIKNPKKEIKDIQRPSKISMKKVQNSGETNVNAGSNIMMNHSTNKGVDMDQMARTFLQRQFELNKNRGDHQASERAKMMGISQRPEYDPYTSKVIGRMKKGHNKFSKEEIGKIKNHLGYMQTQGADLKDYMKNMGPMNVSKIISGFDVDQKDISNKSQKKEIPRFNISDVKKDVKNKEDESFNQGIQNSYKSNYKGPQIGEEQEQKSIQVDDVSMKNLMDQVSKGQQELSDKFERFNKEDISNKKMDRVLENDLEEKLATDDIRTGIERLNKEFNTQFKANQTEEFFENIIKKYGMDQVNDAVQEMKKQSNKRNASARILKLLKEKKNSDK